MYELVAHTRQHIELRVDIVDRQSSRRADHARARADEAVSDLGKVACTDLRATGLPLIDFRSVRAPLRELAASS